MASALTSLTAPISSAGPVLTSPPVKKALNNESISAIGAATSAMLATSSSSTPRSGSSNAPTSLSSSSSSSSSSHSVRISISAPGHDNSECQRLQNSHHNRLNISHDSNDLRKRLFIKAIDKKITATASLAGTAPAPTSSSLPSSSSSSSSSHPVGSLNTTLPLTLSAIPVLERSKERYQKRLNGSNDTIRVMLINSKPELSTKLETGRLNETINHLRAAVSRMESSPFAPEFADERNVILYAFMREIEKYDRLTAQIAKIETQIAWLCENNS